MRERLRDFVAVFGTDDVADAMLVLAEAVDELGAGELLDSDALSRLLEELR